MQLSIVYLNMLLAVDIGNSSIKFGVFDEDKLTAKFSVPTKRDYSVQEIIEEAGDQIPATVDASIVCSVVPLA